MKELVIDKEKCCGCGACANICPKNAICMVEDEYGFVYPQIDETKCIKCGLCSKVCAYNEQKKMIESQESYMAVSKNEEILINSASGGVFFSIAKNIIEKKGVVFGCSMENDVDGNMEPCHVKVTDINGLKKLQGSKYVQSNIKQIYKEVKQELINNKFVLFSGTPCQVSALKSYLGKLDQEKLYTIDLICHGVPSSRMFKDYIKYLEHKNKIKITGFKFRDKSKGWGLFAKISFIKGNKKVEKIFPCISSSFYQLFLDSLIYRKNCYSCPFAGNNRIGDITIGDYWGIEQEHAEYFKKYKLNSAKGISCAIINNTKGKKLIDEFSQGLLILESEFEKIQMHNKQLNKPSEYNSNRELVLKLYKNNGYGSVDKWYKKNKGIEYYIKRMWYFLPYNLRKIVKR
ncbi:MAG: 4Fe-4S dicluster domain-containing protein [Firmicutes bacterium]|nr:4Fe-4S dicluster domain-containing protein [Bacillota bacterium]